MRGEAPECILVSADATKIHPLRIDVVNLAQFAILDHLLQATDYRVVFQQVSHHEYPVFPLCHLGQRFGVTDIEGKRLFDEDIPVRAENLMR